MEERLVVSFYGAGQVGTNASAILRNRAWAEVRGPYARAEREAALCSGADVVVIATTSFLADIADDVQAAIEAGSNVITTAEEAAYPWANEPETATRLDALARSRGVTVLGTGINPGFAFDALVLTACGAVSEVEALLVERVVDLSGFGETVLRRIGVGHSAEQFESGSRSGAITGHIGFPQSMRVVAGRLDVQIDEIERQLEPIFSADEVGAKFLTVMGGQTAGFRQRYVATSQGKPWFEARFIGHVAPDAIGEEPRDSITVRGPQELKLSIKPGINPQTGSAAIVANSIRRVVDSEPGWVTVGDLPPAVPIV